MAWLFSKPDIEKLRHKKDIRSLISLLAYKRDAEIQKKAERALAEIGTVETLIPELPVRLQPSMNRGIRSALDKIDTGWPKSPPTKRIVPKLTQKIGDPRSTAVIEETLAHIGEIVADDLLSLIKNTPPARKMAAAARVLGKIRCEKALPFLLTMLVMKDDACNASAQSALVQIGQPTVVPLCELLVSENGFARMKAVITLGKIREQSSAPHILPLLKDQELLIRVEAARALGEIRDESAVDSLCDLLNDKSIELTADTDKMVNLLLAAQQTPSEQLGPVLSSPTAVAMMCEQLRQVAVEALSKIGSKKALKVLGRALRDSDLCTRCAAADALYEIGDAGSIDALIRSLTDDVLDFCRRVIRALNRISPDWWTQNAAKETLALIVKKLDHRDGWVRTTALNVLAGMNDKSAVKLIIPLLRDDFVDGVGQPIVRNAATQALRKLTEQDFGTDEVQWRNWARQENLF